MIKLHKPAMRTLADLRASLQQAIELEHCIIPPYLTAKFSIHGTNNEQVEALIGSVVGEEMLHVSIACNVLNAIGGSPVLNAPGFIPTYPGKVPGGVDDGLILGLEAFSVNLVQQVFMAFEEPGDPIDITSNDIPEPGWITIGKFYQMIIDTMTLLENEAKASGSTIFTGNPVNQMINEKWFPITELFPIVDLPSAICGINVIVDQGEGTSNDPFVNGANENGNPLVPAHYYRFQEIVEGGLLVRAPGNVPPYTFNGAPVQLDTADIPNMYPNPKMSFYPQGSQAYVTSELFNYTYTNLLNCLHETFNGQPQNINKALGLMFSLRLYASKLLSMPDPIHPGYVAGPSFEYLPVISAPTTIYPQPNP
jgi:hypothetical protein